MKEKLHRIQVYGRVYKTLLRLNVTKLFAYRANFINSAIAHTIWAAFGVISMLLLTSKVATVYGWTPNELMLLAGTYNLILSFFYFFFSRNFGDLADVIHFGKLDTFLLKPIDTQFLISSWNVGYTQLIRFVIGFGVVWYFLVHMGTSLTFVSLVQFMLLLCASVIILYSFWMLVLTLLLWFTNVSNLVDLLYQINGITRFPSEIYKGFGMILFFVLFPLTLIVVSPTKALLQQMTWQEMLVPIGFAIGMGFLCRRFWQFALRFYTSASG
ncbi:MAG: ABC-2 family transporter protein [Patescibacteria group bacterium]